MDFKPVNRITGLIVFLFATVIYVMTVQPTFSFWDTGEFIATAFTLGVPHPPGAPFFMIVGKIFMMLPIAADIGLRMNYLSVFSSAFCVLFLYLVSTKLIKIWKGTPTNAADVMLVCGASAIGALSFAFSESFWFNALESEVYGMGTFLIGLCIYLLMVWWEKADEPGSDKYLLLVAYVVGLSIGIHLIVVQCLVVAGLIFYFRRYDYSRKSLYIAIAISMGIFFLVYPITVMQIPKILQLSVFAGVILLGLIIWGVYYSVQKRSSVLNLAFLSAFLVILGYSTYAMVLVRANVDNLPINENQPDNLEKLISYLSREQYGDQPLIWPRRHSKEPQHRPTYADYSSDADFMWKYQINEMFNRYLFWQYIGRAGHDQGDGIDFSKFYLIPFLIGLLGLFYHFKRDWKMALVFLVMFLLMGVVTALYQNQQDPQPRERDYFYVGAFFVYSLWIGLGVAGIIEFLREKLKSAVMPITAVVVVLCFLAVPVNMLRANYHYMDRAGNYFPFDYAYNILQSADKDAIIFTNGDNDTFPVWCLQTVYGVRTDVRIVNLSLAQTDWYNLQLKNETPHGSLPVPFTYSDEQLRRLIPIQWDEKKVISLDVPPEAYPDSMRSRPNLPNKLQFNVPATIRQQGQGGQTITAVKTSDLIILDILKANNWKRPIYFSVTVDGSNFVGLNEYLMMEGMGQRLLPYKVADATGMAINQEILKKNLYDTPPEPSKTPRYGFLFRGLNDANIFYNQDQERMIETYRTLFLRLALSYSDDSTKFSLAEQTLDKMEQVLPSNVVEMDYRIQYDVAMLYKRIGRDQKFNKYAAEIEKGALEEITKNPRGVQGYYNPYRLLIDIYESGGQYQKAIDILQRLQSISPDPSVQQKIDAIKSKMGGK